MSLLSFILPLLSTNHIFIGLLYMIFGFIGGSLEVEDYQ